MRCSSAFGAPSSRRTCGTTLSTSVRLRKALCPAEAIGFPASLRLRSPDTADRGARCDSSSSPLLPTSSVESAPHEASAASAEAPPSRLCGARRVVSCSQCSTPSSFVSWLAETSREITCGKSRMASPSSRSWLWCTDRMRSAGRCRFSSERSALCSRRSDVRNEYS